jgi:hypothetical protein
METLLRTIENIQLRKPLYLLGLQRLLDGNRKKVYYKGPK